MSRGIARISSLSGLILGVMLTAGCGSSSVATARPTPPAALPGTSWTLGVQGGTAPAAAAARQPTLVFGSDGTLSGNDGCDNYSGAFTASGSAIAITGLTTTSQVECAPETVAIATAFRTSLSAVLVLSPVKLTLSGSEDLVFSQN
jgi:heat shock protein HslJ